MPVSIWYTTWWKWAIPKNKEHTNIAVVGVKHCKSNGNMHALNVHSSARGATTWFLHHVNVRILPSQYIGSKTGKPTFLQLWIKYYIYI